MRVAPDEPVRVRREWNDRRTAEYRLRDLEGLHRAAVSGGVGARSPRPFLHAYVWCDAMLAGDLTHSCAHGEGPHHIKVCIVQKNNRRDVYVHLERQTIHAHYPIAAHSRDSDAL